MLFLGIIGRDVSASAAQLKRDPTKLHKRGEHTSSWSLQIASEVGARIVVLDPKLAKFVEPTGTIIEVRCNGGRVKVQHDGALARPSVLQKLLWRGIGLGQLCDSRCRESRTLLQHWQG